MYRSRAIVIRKNHIALIKRQRYGREYYVIPGGGMEPGETPEQTAIRESREELGLSIAIERLLAKITFRGRDQYYYLARVTGGHFGTGKGPEMTGKYPPDRGTFTPVWVNLREISNINLFPPSIAQFLSQSMETGWPEQAVEIIVEE